VIDGLVVAASAVVSLWLLRRMSAALRGFGATRQSLPPFIWRNFATFVLTVVALSLGSIVLFTSAERIVDDVGTRVVGLFFIVLLASRFRQTK
jgi:hypothetical protein